MKIAICDDSPCDAEKILAAAEEFGREHDIHFDIVSFSSSRELLEDAENNGNFDIALLDICMPDISGIEAARRLRSLNKSISIVFLTTSRDYAIEAFSLAASHYLLKPFSKEQFDEAMNRILGSGNKRKYVTIRSEDELRTVALDEIEYFEVRGHRLYIFLSDKSSLNIRQSMSTLRGYLTENRDFAGCGASYMVNLGHIRKMTTGFLTMDCGAKIPVPRRAYAMLEKQYMDFYRREVSDI